MEKFKTPLTWVLGIVFVGYLFIANCECGEESSCSLNNGFNISNAGINNGFNISNTSLNNGFNISNAGINGDVLKIDASATVEEDGEPAEFSADFIEHLRAQGFSEMEIEFLPFEENADILERYEAEDEEIKEDINPTSTLENMLQNLLEKK